MVADMLLDLTREHRERGRREARGPVRMTTGAAALHELEPTLELGSWRHGFMDFTAAKGRAAFGHGGAGGSIGFADPEHRFAFALSKTRHVAAAPGADAAYLVATETRRALGIPD